MHRPAPVPKHPRSQLLHQHQQQQHQVQHNPTAREITRLLNRVVQQGITQMFLDAVSPIPPTCQ